MCSALGRGMVNVVLWIMCVFVCVCVCVRACVCVCVSKTIPLHTLVRQTVSTSTDPQKVSMYGIL